MCEKPAIQYWTTMAVKQCATPLNRPAGTVVCANRHTGFATNREHLATNKIAAGQHGLLFPKQDRAGRAGQAKAARQIPEARTIECGQEGRILSSDTDLLAKIGIARVNGRSILNRNAPAGTAFSLRLVFRGECGYFCARFSGPTPNPIAINLRNTRG